MRPVHQSQFSVCPSNRVHTIQPRNLRRLDHLYRQTLVVIIKQTVKNIFLAEKIRFATNRLRRCLGAELPGPKCHLDLRR